MSYEYLSLYLCEYHEIYSSNINPSFKRDGNVAASKVFALPETTADRDFASSIMEASWRAIARARTPWARTLRAPTRSYAGKPDIYERVRRGLWKEQPPGQKDPYSWEERHRTVTGQLEAAQPPDVETAASNELDTAPSNVEDAPIDDTRLTPIGGPEGWWEAEWDQRHVYAGYVASTSTSSV